MSKSIYIPPDLLKDAEKAARKENRTISNLVQTAVKKYIQKSTTRKAA